MKKRGTDLFLTVYGRYRIQDESRLSFSPSGGCNRVKIRDGRNGPRRRNMMADYTGLSRAGQGEGNQIIRPNRLVAATEISIKALG